MIAVVDYDTGNLRSVENLLTKLGEEYIVTSDIEAIKNAEKVLLPGVGEASSAMAKLRERSLDEVIPVLTQPVLGICIGVQLMCRISEEGNTKCMGIFDTDVVRFKDKALKIPHMGWNTIENLSSPLFDGIDEGSYIYYVHSFAPQICSQAVATTTYGVEFSAALNKNNFFGTQFHPEKSGVIGEKIVANFLKMK